MRERQFSTEEINRRLGQGWEEIRALLQIKSKITIPCTICISVCLSGLLGGKNIWQDQNKELNRSGIDIKIVYKCTPWVVFNAKWFASARRNSCCLVYRSPQWLCFKISAHVPPPLWLCAFSFSLCRWTLATNHHHWLVIANHFSEENWKFLVMEMDFLITAFLFSDAFPPSYRDGPELVAQLDSLGLVR